MQSTRDPLTRESAGGGNPSARRLPRTSLRLLLTLAWANLALLLLLALYDVLLGLVSAASLAGN